MSESPSSLEPDSQQRDSTNNEEESGSLISRAENDSDTLQKLNEESVHLKTQLQITKDAMDLQGAEYAYKLQSVSCLQQTAKSVDRKNEITDSETKAVEGKYEKWKSRAKQCELVLLRERAKYSGLKAKNEELSRNIKELEEENRMNRALAAKNMKSAENLKAELQNAMRTIDDLTSKPKKAESLLGAESRPRKLNGAKKRQERAEICKLIDRSFSNILKSFESLEKVAGIEKPSMLRPLIIVTAFIYRITRPEALGQCCKAENLSRFCPVQRSRVDELKELCKRKIEENRHMDKTDGPKALKIVSNGSKQLESKLHADIGAENSDQILAERTKELLSLERQHMKMCQQSQRVRVSFIEGGRIGPINPHFLGL